jgi:hypothetical protein
MATSEEFHGAETFGNSVCPQCRQLHSTEEQGVLVGAIQKNWKRIDQIVRRFEDAIAVNQKSERMNFEFCLAQVAEVIPAASICDVAYIIALWRGNNLCGAELPAYVIPEKVVLP